MNEQAAAMIAQLGGFLEKVTGSAVQFERIWPLAGGASRETWAVDILVERGDEAGAQALVLRLDTASTMNPDALKRADEFHLWQIAQEAGVACPRPRWLCDDPAVLGAPFFLMERVEGESIGPRVVRRPELAAARAALPRQMAEQLARIHAIDRPAHELAFLPRPANNKTAAQHLIDRLRGILAELEVYNPGLTAGLRWLENNQPPDSPRYLLHGDFRIGNLIVNSEGLAAVIDWEFAHFGEPLEDLAWPLVRDWRFGNKHLRLGGIADAEPYLLAYEEASGRTVDRWAVTYWEIMGNMKWAVTCLAQANRHLSGQDPSIELASLGRRSAEMELELLNLIETLMPVVRSQ